MSVENKLAVAYLRSFEVVNEARSTPKNAIVSKSPQVQSCSAYDIAFSNLDHAAKRRNALPRSVEELTRQTVQDEINSTPFRRRHDLVVERARPGVENPVSWDPVTAYQSQSQSAIQADSKELTFRSDTELFRHSRQWRRSGTVSSLSWVFRKGSLDSPPHL